MTHLSVILLTAIAPAIWGSTYIVTTEFLPAGYPLTLAMLRALPAGLLLLLIVRELPSSFIWFGKIFILGALNFAIFWWLLFETAYRLPGGVAATLGATQPLMVIFLSRFLIKHPISIFAIFAALAGLAGVALLIVTPAAQFDSLGILAGTLSAVSMALGTVLTRKWQPPVSLLTFTSWQLTAGGLLLVPAALFLEPSLGTLSSTNIIGFVYLGLIGGAVTYILWFNGIAKIDPSKISVLGFLSPTTAVFLGWSFLDQNLTSFQLLGFILVLASVWLSQKKPPKLNSTLSQGKIT